MELGEDHELYEELPYYWHHFGPVSTLTHNSINHLSKNNILSNGNMANSYFKTFKGNSISNNYPEVNLILNGILNKDICEIDKEIYKDYAPYKFMYPYRFKIFECAKNNETVDFPDRENLVNLFIKCESKLPFDGYFFEFSNVFSKIVKSLILLEKSPNFNEFWPDLRKILQEAWLTFTDGLRVMYKDNFYNSLEKEWDLEYQTKLSNLKGMVKNFEEKIMHSDLNYTLSEYDEIEKKFLNQTLQIII